LELEQAEAIEAKIQELKAALEATYDLPGLLREWEATEAKHPASHSAVRNLEKAASISV
jgi:hypothetical protein